MTLSVTSPSADRNTTIASRVSGSPFSARHTSKPSSSGHHHIEQDEIGMHPARNVERRAAVLRREQAITAPLERAHDQSQIHRAVVDDRDCCTRRLQRRTARRKGHHTSHRSKGSKQGSRLLLERLRQPEQRIVIESGRQDRNAPPECSGNVSALVRQLVSDRVEIGNAADWPPHECVRRAAAPSPGPIEVSGGSAVSPFSIGLTKRTRV